jgi:hypothetical protein
MARRNALLMFRGKWWSSHDRSIKTCEKPNHANHLF